MQSPSWMTSHNSNFSVHTSGFWSNRKRKMTESDYEDKCENKRFLTEENLIKNMQTLCLDLCKNNLTFISEQNQIEEKSETKIEIHQLLKENLKIDDLQDKFLHQLCDFERKKLSMQIVPYIPIHPVQFKSINEEKEQDNQTKIKPNDDHLFKKPFSPTPYTVEEPPENTLKRRLRMKRSYSQSQRSNSNLSVVEVKSDSIDYSFSHSQSDYLIFEPTTPIVFESSKNHFNSSYSTNRSSIRITEYFDVSSSNTNDDIDIQSIVLSDINNDTDDDN